MGYLDELRETIERVRERASTNGDHLRSSEFATRIALVDPILRVLGWDVSDPTQVTVEYRIDEFKVDYALLSEGQVYALVEAKKLGALLDQSQWQIAHYSGRVRARYAVLTDGDEWRILNPASAQQPLLKTLRISKGATRPLCLSMLEYLDSPGVHPDAPRPEIMVLPASHRPTAPPTGGAQGGEWVPLSELEARLLEAGGKSADLPLAELALPNGSKIEIKSYAGIVRACAESVKDELSRILPLLDARGKTRHIASRDGTHPSGKSFHTRAKVGDFYTDVGYSSVGLLRNAIHILRACGADPATYRVRLRQGRTTPIEG